MIHNISAQTGPVEQPPGSHRRKRKTVNCEECRRSKLRCDRQHPCGACKRRRREDSCSYEVSTGIPLSMNTHRTPVNAQASTVFSNRVESPSTPSRQNLASAPASQSELQVPETNQTPLDTHWETVLERPAPESDAHDTLSPLSIGLRMSL